jgi:hypothetical protein
MGQQIDADFKHLALAKNVSNYFETLVSRFLRRSRRERTLEASYPSNP